MRRALSVILGWYVFLSSLAVAAMVTVSAGQGKLVIGVAQGIQIVLVSMGLASAYFLLRKSRMLLWVHVAWWVPHVIEFRLGPVDQVINQVPTYSALVGPRQSFSLGWNLEGGGLLLIGLNSVALLGLIGSCVAMAKGWPAESDTGTEIEEPTAMRVDGGTAE